MSASDLAPDARRIVPVEPTGRLATGSTGPLWACELFDGLLWQLIAMARTEQECREFLRGT